MATNMTIAEKLVALTDALGENGAQELLEVLMERQRAAKPSTVEAAIAEAATEVVGTRAAGFGKVGDESIALPVVPDAAWDAAEINDRPLNDAELEAISLHGANGLVRMNADGVAAHPANTVRLRWVRENRNDSHNHRVRLAGYYTLANGVDCDEPVYWTPAQARKLFNPQLIINENSVNAEQVVWGASQPWTPKLGRQPVSPVTGKGLDRCSKYSMRTFVYEMEIAGVTQSWRFFAPKLVSEILWTMWKQNTVESVARMKKLLPLSGDLLMTDIHRFDAAVRIDRIVGNFTHAPLNAIAAGRFRFSMIGSSVNRARAINSAAAALFLARTVSAEEKAELVEKLLNTSGELLQYRMINADSRRAADAGEEQEQVPAPQQPQQQVPAPTTTARTATWDEVPF